MEEKRKKRWGDRRDGTLIRDVDALHLIMPYLYPNKTDNEAFISERIDLTPINEYIARKNQELAEAREAARRASEGEGQAEAPKPQAQGGTEGETAEDNAAKVPGTDLTVAELAANEPYKFFYVLLAALVKTVTLRPKMNRFIKGGRMYQRNDLSLAFVVKKQFNDDAEEALAFIKFDENTTLNDVRIRLGEEIHACRGDRGDNSTDQMELITKLPNFLLRFAMWILHKLDYYGHVPYDLIKTDPNHASVFITNLGSIGLKSGYHHLSNWGTNSIFVIIGEKKMSPFYDENGNITMKETIDLGLTLDERIADGYYYSKTVKLLKHLLAHPELLELPAKEEVDYAK